MDKKTSQLIKDMIWSGIQQVQFNIQKAQVDTSNKVVHIGSINSQKQIHFIIKQARDILDSIKQDKDIPTEINELEYFVVWKVEEDNFEKACSSIQSKFINRQEIQQCHEAIEELKSMGENYKEKANSFELRLDKKIKQAKE